MVVEDEGNYRTFRFSDGSFLVCKKEPLNENGKMDIVAVKDITTGYVRY
jgi:hypothetical protein